MMFTLAATLILSFLARTSSQGCGEATQRITYPDGLVKISANPLLETNRNVDPRQLEILESNTNPWCSVPPPVPADRTVYDPYLTFDLSSTHLIERVRISGRADGDRVIRTLTVLNDTGQGFAFIKDNSGIPKVFLTFLTRGGYVSGFNFTDRPVLATSLQIRPLTWNGDFPCVRIELYGCLYSTVTGRNSPTSGVATSNGTVQNNSSTEREFGLTIIISVGIGAAIFGALVATVTNLAVKGIVYCCKTRRPTSDSVRAYSTSNEAYGVPEKYNIELQPNKCYKPVAPPAEQMAASQHEDLDYTYPTLQPTTTEH